MLGRRHAGDDEVVAAAHGAQPGVALAAGERRLRGGGRAGGQRDRVSLRVDHDVEGEAQRRHRRQLAHDLLEGVAREPSELDARPVEKARVVRPGDGARSGATDGDGLGAAREAGVEVGLDDAHGDDEIGAGELQVHESGCAAARLVQEDADLAQALGVAHRDPARRRATGQQHLLLGGRRAVHAAGDQHPHPVVRDAGGVELVEERGKQEEGGARPAGVGDGDDDPLGAAGQVCQAWRADGMGQCVGDGGMYLWQRGEVRRGLDVERRGARRQALDVERDAPRPVEHPRAVHRRLALQLR